VSGLLTLVALVPPPFKETLDSDDHPSKEGSFYEPHTSDEEDEDSVRRGEADSDYEEPVKGKKGMLSLFFPFSLELA
jgi:hypothetical protein